MKPGADYSYLGFIPIDGVIAQAITSVDWHETPLGSPEQWPQSLRTALSIILHSDTAYYLFWGTEGIIFLNDTANRISSEQHTTGKKAQDVFPGIVPHLAKVLNGGTVAGGTGNFLNTKDSLTAVYSPVVGDPGAIAGVLVSLKQAAPAREQTSHEYLNDLIQAPVAMGLFRGPQFTVEVANELMLELMGKPAAEVINKPVFDALPETRGQGLEGLLEEVSATGKPFSANERPVYLPRNGSSELIYVDFICKPVAGLNGAFTGIVVIASDVTRQVQARIEIEQSEKRFRSIADCVPVLIWMSGTDKLCYFFNKAWLDFTGRSMEQELGNGWAENVHPEDMERCLETYTTSFDKHVEFYMEYRMRRRDGSYRWVSDTGVPRFTPDGVFEGYIGACMDIHDELSNRRRVKENEERLNIVIESSGLAVWELDVETQEIRYGRRYMEIFGYDDDTDLSHAELVAHFHPEDTKRRKKAFERAFAKGRLNYQARIIWPDKSIHWIEVRGKVFYNHAHEPEKVIGTLRDITEDKYHEQLLQERETKFRLLADSMPQFVWTGDIEGNLNYFNESVYRYSGLTPKKIQEEGWLQIVHPDEREENVRLWMESINSGQDFIFEHRFRRSDGVYRWQLSRAIAQKDEHGNIKMWVGTSTDIEDSKTEAIRLEKIIEERTRELLVANESLQQSNMENALSKYNKRFLMDFSERFSTAAPHVEFFNSLVQYISDITGLDYVLIGELEQAGKEILVNTLSLVAMGKLKKNITYSTFAGPCEKVIENKTYIYPEGSREIFPGSKALQQFEVEGYIGYPLFDNNENPIGLIVVMHRKKIEDSDTVASILRIVAKRAEIEMERLRHEEQLRQNNTTLADANTHLDKMNKELEAFAYISSHDLQEPLRKIQMFSTRIMEKELDKLSESGQHYFGRIQNAAARMQTLIDDLLSYSRTSTTERKFETVHLRTLIDDVQNELKELLAEKGAVVEVDDMRELRIIPYQFRQLMHNFFTNALKFSRPEVSPHITITGKVLDGRLMPGILMPDRVYCYISFADNGIGFEPEYKERIFEVFQRLHGKDEYAGTGIGLAIVKKIVENHNGFISATGEPGQGATFELYIPVT